MLRPKQLLMVLFHAGSHRVKEYEEDIVLKAKFGNPESYYHPNSLPLNCRGVNILVTDFRNLNL